MIRRIKRPVKGRLFVPIRLNNIHSVRTIPKKNLTWAQASIRYPRMQALGDADRDGKLNMFDCHPFDKKRHGDPNINFGFRDEIPSRFSSKPERSEKETHDIIKAIWWKKQWQDFRDAKRKDIIDDDVGIQEFVDYRQDKKAKAESKRISDVQRARDLGLLEEE